MKPVNKDGTATEMCLVTSPGTQPRIVPTELSHEILGNDTVRTKYRAGYCQFTVTSRFTGDKPLSDALFEILSGISE